MDSNSFANSNATEEQVIQALQDFWNEKISFERVNEIFCSYQNNSSEYRKNHSHTLCSKLLEILFSKDTIIDFYYMMSAIFSMTMIPEVYYEIIRTCTEDDTLSKETKFFLFCQCINYKFLIPEINTIQSRQLLDDLYETIYQSYLNDVKDLCKRIPISERNNDLIIVMTSQLLGLNHGPTKTLLDRCYTLETQLGKKTYIINVADALTSYGMINWFNIRLGNYAEALGTDGQITYKGLNFPYYQCPPQMLQVSIIREILMTIRETKPRFIVAIGDKNITSDLCSTIVPVLTVTLGPSERCITRSTFQMTGHATNDEDKMWLKKHHFSETHIIEGLFTSAFKPQTHNFSRKELGLEDGWIICLVVGGRLDSEIDDEFMNLVTSLACHGIYTVFMGHFNNYDTYADRDSVLKSYTRNLGFQDDALAICECCDIYINPTRSGGGTSAAEALFKGLPVLTVNYGDVAIGAGNDFWVKDYEEMLDRAIQLSKDKEYYKEMSDKALKRAAKLTDTEGEFVRIIKEMESRPEFF